MREILLEKIITLRQKVLFAKDSGQQLPGDGGSLWKHHLDGKIWRSKLELKIKIMTHKQKVKGQRVEKNHLGSLPCLLQLAVLQQGGQEQRLTNYEWDLIGVFPLPQDSPSNLSNNLWTFFGTPYWCFGNRGEHCPKGIPCLSVCKPLKLIINEMNGTAQS